MCAYASQSVPYTYIVCVCSSMVNRPPDIVFFLSQKPPKTIRIYACFSSSSTSRFDRFSGIETSIRNQTNETHMQMCVNLCGQTRTGRAHVRHNSCGTRGTSYFSSFFPLSDFCCFSSFFDLIGMSNGMQTEKYVYPRGKRRIKIICSHTHARTRAESRTCK